MRQSRAAGFKLAEGLAMVPAMQMRRSALPLIGILLLALCLAACGRKSGLDLPPSAAAAPAETEVKSISPIGKPPKSQPRVAPNRSLPIDILLN